MLPAVACASVQVIVGPTPIDQGEAKSAGDITVVNEKLAFALAVTSRVPYGVPRGALIDLAPVTNGKIGTDCVVFADFIPNNWSAWPNTFQPTHFCERVRFHIDDAAVPVGDRAIHFGGRRCK